MSCNPPTPESGVYSYTIPHPASKTLTSWQHRGLKTFCSFKVYSSTLLQCCTDNGTIESVSQTLKQRKTKMSNSIKTFTAGKTYYCNWITDADLKTPFEIVRRSQKSVWIKGGEMNDRNAVVRRSIEIIDDEETFSPFGKYSMSPITRAAHIWEK